MHEQNNFKCDMEWAFADPLALMMIDEVSKVFGNSEISIAQRDESM